ncbi:hypothetical protein SAMN05443245_5860 [Paraburkholderia fungorum]|uniref:Uncharacterized protein n=1 Tax=Paraburkholderia fungorum TaxID=134537 RepID=A0A1H1IXY9_9BURK|nr:hypothetical protein [Paraburkholderia fungorum]SDR42574.1 hypothetical protein SAMN05443245_5860 [Paraburkholderia fungorum]
MSRYYKITISDPKTGKVFVPNVGGKLGFTTVDPGAGVWTYCSLNPGGNPNALGSVNPAALKIELDITAGFMHQPIGNSYIRVYGISLAEIAQGSNLNRMNIAVEAGMSKGLPLAVPAQIGPLCKGQIFQAFGNWIGPNQTLDIFVQAGGSSANANTTTGFPAGDTTLPAPTTNDNPGYLTFQWQPGQHLMDAMVQALSIVYPQYSISGSISPNLVWTGTAATGFYTKLSQFAEYVNKASINLIGGYAPDTSAYPGVMISLQGNQIIIQDGTTPTTPKQLLVTDLLGQPTWVDAVTIQATCILRGDISPGNYVTLPNGPLTITQGSQSNFFLPPTSGGINTQLKNQTAFTGTFLVSNVRHVGSSRDGQGTSWVTTLDLLNNSVQSSTATVPALPVVQARNTNAYNFYLP